MDDTDVLTTKVAITAMLLSEAGKKLVAPVAEQLGGAFGDFASILRFYQNENLGKIFTKWAERRDSRPGLAFKDLSKVLPLLPQASLQGNDELQGRWATLLESSVSSEKGFLPSFGQTLNQLTPEEAKFLDRLVVEFEGFMEERPWPYSGIQREHLVRTYDPSITKVWDSGERMAFVNGIDPELRDEFVKLEQADLVIDDLERLGIIQERSKSDRTNNLFFLSQYGASFIQAVSSKAPKQVRTKSLI